MSDSTVIKKEDLQRILKEASTSAKFSLPRDSCTQVIEGDIDNLFYDSLGSDKLVLETAKSDGIKSVSGKWRSSPYPNELDTTVDFDVDASGGATAFTIRVSLKGQKDVVFGSNRFTLDNLESFGLQDPEFVWRTRIEKNFALVESYAQVSYPSLGVKARIHTSRDGLFIERISVPIDRNISDMGQIATLSLPGIGNISAPDSVVKSALDSIAPGLKNLNLKEIGIDLLSGAPDATVQIMPSAAWVRLTVGDISLPGDIGKVKNATLLLTYQLGTKNPLGGTISGECEIEGVKFFGYITIPGLLFRAEVSASQGDMGVIPVKAIGMDFPASSTIAGGYVEGDLRTRQLSLVCSIGGPPLPLVEGISISSPSLRLDRDGSSSSWSVSMRGSLIYKDIFTLDLLAQKFGSSWSFDADLTADDLTLKQVLSAFGAESIDWLEKPHVKRVAIHVDRNQKATSATAIVQGDATWGSTTGKISVSITMGAVANVTVRLTLDFPKQSMTFVITADRDRIKGTWRADPPIDPEDVAELIADGQAPEGLMDVLALIPVKIESINIGIGKDGSKMFSMSTTRGGSLVAAVA